MRVADQCEVAVIGAGPAVSTAAQLLASWAGRSSCSTAALARRVAAGEHAQPDHNGLAPEEAQPAALGAERRMIDWACI